MNHRDSAPLPAGAPPRPLSPQGERELSPQPLHTLRVPPTVSARDAPLVNPKLIRSYDLRGQVGTDLTEADARALGLSYAAALQGGTAAQGNKTESILGAVNERTGEMRRMNSAQPSAGVVITNDAAGRAAFAQLPSGATYTGPDGKQYKKN